VTEVLDRRGRPVDARSLEGEAQERAVLGRANPALLLLAFQVEMGPKKPRDTGFDAFACSLTFDDDQEVLPGAGEARAASFQFLVVF